MRNTVFHVFYAFTILTLLLCAASVMFSGGNSHQHQPDAGGAVVVCECANWQPVIHQLASEVRELSSQITVLRLDINRLQIRAGDVSPF